LSSSENEEETEEGEEEAGEGEEQWDVERHPER
jgi:hypothetical protein